MELTSVADDEAVLFDGTALRRYRDLQADTDHDIDGLTFRTLPRPGGELLCRLATVNDVHFGEVECGVLEGLEMGPVFRGEPGHDPYPEVMNRAAAAEMAEIEPAAVVVKGDLTAEGTQAEYDAFLACYASAFGDALVHVRGNHDGYHGATFAATPAQLVELPGARVAVIDTTIPGLHTGQVRDAELQWLDDVGADADRDGVPVLGFGHHHPWDPGSKKREDGYFGIRPDDSERLVDVVARHPSICGWFAGHTHRNRVRHFAATGGVPWVEVACVKDFPGAWAEYRIYEGGALQVFHRIGEPAALAWTEKTRGMFGGLYPDYAFGTIADRSFPIPFSTQ
jgi:3',5'-cyclic AMP phosphodiesterase CpdA